MNGTQSEGLTPVKAATAYSESDAPIESSQQDLPEPEPGQVVAHGITFFGECFRCMLELTKDHHYLVQEFSAAQGEKRSEPYILTSKEAVYSKFFDFWQEQQAPIEGAYILWGNQGQKYLQGQFKNGHKHGVWEYWSVDGQKVVEEKYSYGKLEGPWRRWSYGVKFIEGHYTEGKRTGFWRQWWFNGKICSQGNYYAGMHHGEWNWWRRDGLKLVQGMYDSGRKTGVWLRWNRHGKLIGRKNYVKEKQDLLTWLYEKHNIIIDWDKTLEQDLLLRERIKVSNIYDNSATNYSREFLGITPEGHYVVRDFYVTGDEKFTDPYILLDRQAIFEKEFDYWSSAWRIEGAYTQWHSNGCKSLVMHFKKGIRHGLQTDWDNQGHKITEKSFDNNALNGFYCLWYPDGQLHEKRYYSHNTRTGLWVSWWGNGEKKCQGTYQNDFLNGRWNWWHNNGTDMAQGYYRNGRKIGLWQWWNIERKQEDSKDYSDPKCIAQWLKEEHNLQVINSDAIATDYKYDVPLSHNHEKDLANPPVGYRFPVHDIDFTNTYERVYLGTTLEGFDVVQDFYWNEGDRQRTAPYMLQDKNCSPLLYCEVDDIQRCGIEGTYQQWYPTGKMEFSAHMKSGRATGLWRWWNASGQLLKSIDYDQKNSEVDGNINSR